MPKSLELAVGIMMCLSGLVMLTRMRTVKKRLLNDQEAGEHTAEDLRRELKNIKLVTICSLVVGCGLVCRYIFNL